MWTLRFEWLTFMWIFRWSSLSWFADRTTCRRSLREENSRPMNSIFERSVWSKWKNRTKKISSLLDRLELERWKIWMVTKRNILCFVSSRRNYSFGWQRFSIHSTVFLFSFVMNRSERIFFLFSFPHLYVTQIEFSPCERFFVSSSFHPSVRTGKTQCVIPFEQPNSTMFQ